MKGLPLHIRIPMLIIFSIAMVGLTSTFFVHRRIIDLLQADLDRLGREVSVALADHAVEHVIYDERLPLRDLLVETVHGNADIEYAFVYEPDKGIIGHSFTRGFPLTLLRLARAETNSEPFLITRLSTNSDLITHIQAPLIEGLPTRLHIGLSESAMHYEADAIRNAILLITLLTIIAGSIVSVILSLRTTSPLRRLSETITAYASGQDMDTIGTAITEGNPEIRGLAESFSNMVSARQKAEKALKESEERFRSLTENSSDWIWEFDENEIFTYASPGIRDLLGYEPEEVIGKSAFDLIPPAEAEEVRKEFDVIQGNCEPFFALENTNQHKDGHLVILESSGVPFFDTEGHFKGYRGIDRDISARKKVQRQLTESLAEKEVLLKEIHHRVKNNMQIVSSMLFLQAQHTDNPQAKAILLESQDRVKSMGLIHERLYSSGNLARINFNDYISTLVQSISHSYSSVGAVNFVIDAADIMLPVDKAIPCGLIINELVTNSFKHAFPEGGGEIWINLFCADNTITLSVEDSGVGLTDDHDLVTNNTLGMSLINNLAGQLDARLIFETGHGLKCTLVFEGENAGIVC